jgi:acyl-CoA hydrolase
VEKEYEKKKVSIEGLAGVIYPGSCVYVESGCAEPQHLARHLIFENMALCDVQVYTSVPLRTYSDFGGDCGSRFRLQSFFISPSMTSAFAEGNADHLPLSTTGIYKLFSEGYIKINTALIQLSPPDSKGFMSLGVIGGNHALHYRLGRRGHRAGQPKMPMTRGDSMIHLDDDRLHRRA